MTETIDLMKPGSDQRAEKKILIIDDDEHLLQGLTPRLEN